MSMMHNILSHEIEASVAWKIATITFYSRCLGVAFEKIYSDLLTLSEKFSRSVRIIAAKMT